MDYIVDGKSPDEIDTIIIRVSTTDPEITPTEVAIQVIPPPIFAYVSPEFLSASDTTLVVIKKRLPDGSLTDFHPTQTFEIGMLEGCTLGKIHAGGIDSNYFYGITQPIYFIVDSAASDTGEVLLRIGLIEEILRKNNTLFELTTTCFSGNYLTTTYDDAKAVVDNPLEIISPTPLTIEWITADPQMPNVICKAKLHNYNKGLVNYEWEYWVSYTLFRHKFTSADTLCRRTGKIKFIGNSTANNSDITFWTVSFSSSNVDSAIFIGKHYSQEGGCFAVIPQWYEGENVFIGGDVFVQVTARNSNGQIIGFRQQNSGVILGNNPPSHAIQDYAGSNELKAIIYHESLINSTYGRWKQFNPQDIDLYYPNIKKWLYGNMYNKKGYPNYGVPNGYGLAKIDNSPSPTEMDLWNWKNNINTSRTRLESAKIHSTNYIINTGATYEEDKFWMNAFQDYNSGKKYWIWDEDEGWQKNKSRPNEYGKTIYVIYQSFNNKFGVMK